MAGNTSDCNCGLRAHHEAAPSFETDGDEHCIAVHTSEIWRL